MKVRPSGLKRTAVAFLLLIIILVCIHPGWAEMTVHFIDLGQGGGVLIQKDGKTILYDCGDTFAVPTMAKYLDALSVSRLRHACYLQRPRRPHGWIPRGDNERLSFGFLGFCILKCNEMIGYE